jgi:hypothetical protein
VNAPAVLGMPSPAPWIAEIGPAHADRYVGIDDLCQAMEAVCASAVDPLEVAAALEFAGLSDRSARERYAMPTVFALAEEMYRRVPREPAEPVPAAAPRLGIGRSEPRSVLAGLALGFLAPALVLVPVLPGPRTDPGAGAAVALAAVGLSLSMGAVRWCVSSYRHRIRRLLRTTHRLGGFGRRARLALLRAVGQYLAVALVLATTGAVIGVGTTAIRPGWPALAVLVSFLALGCAIFVSLLLLAHDRGAAAVLACAVALTGEMVFRDGGAWVRPLVSGGLLALLGGYAAVVLGRATPHA